MSIQASSSSLEACDYICISHVCISCVLHVHVRVYWYLHHSVHVEAFGVRPHLSPCFKAVSIVFPAIYARLAGP